MFSGKISQTILQYSRVASTTHVQTNNEAFKQKALIPLQVQKGIIDCDILIFGGQSHPSGRPSNRPLRPFNGQKDTDTERQTRQTDGYIFLEFFLDFDMGVRGMYPVK